MPGREMRFWGWGEDARAGEPLAHRLDWLRERLGTSLAAPSPPPRLDDLRLDTGALTGATLGELRTIVGAGGVRDDRAARVQHAAGKGYPDLVRLRSGDARPAPDAVVWPATHAQTRAVLELCARRGIAVVPFGGGTSVVGGVEPLRGSHGSVIALDTGRMSRLVALDERSCLAVLEPGLRGPEVEHLLRARGWTLGHLPQSFEYSTAGGWVATRSAGQASTGYGRIDALVHGARLAAPAGDVVLPAMPASAAGPDLRELLVGSEGVLGVLTQVTLRVRPRPASGRYEAWMLPGFQAGREALRTLTQDGLAPDVARLSDEPETEMSLVLAGGGLRSALLDRYVRARGVDGGALAIVGWEGEPARVAWRRRGGAAALRRFGGVALGPGPGRAWARGRFHAPYLRDDLLARGVLVDTLETAAPWSGLERLYRSVRDALGEHAPLVACHVSHLYPTGASLYFTFLARQDAGDPLGQWSRAKRAACEAIVAAGGTISHHHAVGRDHARYLPAEASPLGVEALRAAKARLDPSGIMNPGKLLTDSPIGATDFAQRIWTGPLR